MEEREHIEAARDAFRQAEKLIADGIRDIGAVVKINSGDPASASLMNAACLARGKMRIALGQFEVAHAEGTQILFDNWPGFGSEVVAYGPPR